MPVKKMDVTRNIILILFIPAVLPCGWGIKYTWKTEDLPCLYKVDYLNQLILKYLWDFFF